MEHILTAAIGLAKEADIYYFENIIKKGDQILLCSDRLYNLFANEEELIKAMSASILVDDNLPDDTTAVIMQIREIDQTCKLKVIKLSIPSKLTADKEIDGYTLVKPLVQNERTWLCSQKGIKYVIKFDLMKHWKMKKYWISLSKKHEMQND